MRRSSLALVVTFAAAIGSAALAQTKPAQSPEPISVIKYEPVAPGVQAAELFRTDALRGVIVEVKDVILGPGKSVPTMPAQGFAVTELKSGEVDTAIDGQTVKRRPGDFWLVRPGQQYAVTNGTGMAVLHVALFTRP